MTERILNDRYALESKVGEGGMAVTYRARDLLLNRVVAVKLMREQFTSDPQFVERFRREAQAAARLSHEHIAGVYDTGRCNGTYYIVMEFVEGTDLKQRLRQTGPLPVPEALEFGRQIAAALDAAHRSGLVHRDIKPHNILINRDGKVKVTDFGIAKLTSDGEDTGVIIGSVHYISPEQARGEATTPSSDLYSLGTVLFEMLTGRTVFEAENAMAVAQKQIYDKPPLPRSLRPDIPPAVESMVLRCLEKDPRSRYQSAAELQAVITQLQAQLAQEATVILTPAAPAMDATMLMPEPSAPRPVAPAPYVPRQADPPMARGSAGKGGKGWLLGTFLVLVAISAGIIAYTLLKPGPKPPPPDPIPPAPKISVPTLTGLTRDVALAAGKDARLQVEVRTDFSDVTEGTVFRQDPAAVAQVDEGATVTMWVSKGPKEFIMPTVVDELLTDAKKDVRTAGYWKAQQIVVKTKPALPEQQPNTVVETDPPAGTVVKFGKVVTLYVPDVPLTESYTDTVPNIGADPVFVRVEISRDSGPAQEMWSGTLSAGEAIPRQTFSRRKNEKVVVRMLAGKDAESLSQQTEVPYPPGQAASPASDGV